MGSLSGTHKGDILEYLEVNVLRQMTQDNGFEYPVEEVLVLSRETSEVQIASNALPQVNIVQLDEDSPQQGALFQTLRTQLTIRLDIVVDEGDEEQSEVALLRLQEDIRRELLKEYTMGGAAHMTNIESSDRAYLEGTAVLGTITVVFTYMEHLSIPRRTP